MPEQFGTETCSLPPSGPDCLPFSFPGETRVCLSLPGECQARQHPQPTAADSLQLGVGAWRAVPCAWVGGGCVHHMTVTSSLLALGPEEAWGP